MKFKLSQSASVEHPGVPVREHLIFDAPKYDLGAIFTQKAPLKRGLGGQNSSKFDERGPKEKQEKQKGSQECPQGGPKEPSCPQKLKNRSKIDPKSTPKRVKSQEKTSSK